MLERDSGVYNELQPGSYVFMDADYGRNADRAVVDAGLKALAMDSGPPLVVGWPGLEYTKASDGHGVLAIAPGASAPALGDKLRLVPGHCDPTVNLYDALMECAEATWSAYGPSPRGERCASVRARPYRVTVPRGVRIIAASRGVGA